MNPAGARRQHLQAKHQPCLAWLPRQDLSLSLWKQAAQSVNLLGLGAPAPLRLKVSLSPTPSQGWEAGDSPVLAKHLGQGGGTQPRSFVWEVGLMFWDLRSGGRAVGGKWGIEVMARRAGEGLMLL